MVHWEYLAVIMRMSRDRKAPGWTVSVSGDAGIEGGFYSLSIAEIFGQMGRCGWELVGVLQDDTAFETAAGAVAIYPVAQTLVAFRAFFKRPILS